MSEDPSASSTPKTQQFRRAIRRSPMSPELQRRQAIVTDAAWRFFRTGPAMKAFLNDEHAELGGRPLDRAMDSDEGLRAVLAILAPAPGETSRP